jgi:hypothetical protein
VLEHNRAMYRHLYCVRCDAKHLETLSRISHLALEENNLPPGVGEGGTVKFAGIQSLLGFILSWNKNPLMNRLG